MKVLLVNGSPHENGCTYTALVASDNRGSSEKQQSRQHQTTILRNSLKN